MSSLGPLAESERRRLKDLARRAVGRVSDRMRMVLLASRGDSLAQIAAIFECEEATVRQWLERYQQEGDSGLQDRPRLGRPRKADAVTRSALCHAVEQAPPRWAIASVTGRRERWRRIWRHIWRSGSASP